MGRRGPTLAGLRPEVAAFALLMEAKLREKDGEHGGSSWKGRPDLVEWMFKRLGDEVRELSEALHAGRQYRFRKALGPHEALGRISALGPDGELMVADLGDYTIVRGPDEIADIGLECADVANFAMMIADLVGALNGGLALVKGPRS
jgi:hypothetical protein